jgi:pantoate kinase
MRRIAHYVSAYPGTGLADVVAQTCYHRTSGYGAVRRTEAAGLIRLEQDPTHSHRYLVFPT